MININILSHDGDFINAIYRTPDGKSTNQDGNSFQKTTRAIKEYQKLLEEKSVENLPWTTLADALEEIVKAFTSKGVEVMTAAKDEVVTELEKLAGDKADK